MFKPETFNEVFGQNHIVKTLKDMELGGKSIFFEGERGSGKTSMATILAKRFSDSKYNTQHINCGQVSTVTEIRELINTISKSSIFGKKKTFILDEPQLLSYKAANALLIPLENLQKNVLFIMCSALSEKIEPMLIDRFIRFKTRALSNKTSREFLEYVCQRNNIELDKFKKVLIVEKCDGNPRRIVKAIPKIKDIDDAKDIEYLLDLNALAEDEDILLLFKLLVAKSVWGKIIKTLKDLLKIKNPNEIRIGMLNLIGNGLLKGFGKGKEKELIDMYNILEKAYGIPEKASLITAIGEIYYG